MDADRRHETPGSETKDFVIDGKSSGQSVNMLTKDSLVPIHTGVTWMGLDECWNMQWICITVQEL